MSPRPAIDHIRRPQILDAAQQVITERGLSATRIADIAERAGTSAPAVLYWFNSREELLNAALVADEEDFAINLGKRLESLESAPAKLRLIIEATVGDCDISLWIELWTRSLHDPAAAVERRRLDDVWREMLAAVIAIGQADGQFDPEPDPWEAALSLASLMDGLEVQLTLNDPAVSPERILAITITHAEALLGASLQASPGDEAAEMALA
jgi:AcrR family transcriptional regulator